MNYWKSLFSIFEQFVDSIKEFFILNGTLGTRLSCFVV